MAENKKKVQSIGLWDEEVKMPEHDEMCVWAYQNALTIFERLQPSAFTPHWSAIDAVDYQLNEFKKRPDVRDIAKQFAAQNPKPLPQLQVRELEPPLISYSGYQERTQRLVGYADLFFKVKTPKLEYSSDTKDISISWESVNVLVEAKTTIPTLGALMRQMRLYKTAFHGKMVVLSSDDRFADILEEQGIAFIKYAPLQPRGLEITRALECVALPR